MMSRTQSNAAAAETDRRDAGPGPAPEAIPARDARPLDWRHVVDAAAARLEESLFRPDASGYMAASGLADELAATLCAYGMVANEVAHMHGRADDLAVRGPLNDGGKPLLGMPISLAAAPK